MQRTYKYEEMLPEEFLAAVERMPVFLVPTGLLEWHGEHLPLGQDTLKAYGLCLETARKLGGGIVLPPNYWGRPGFSSYVGTLTFSENMEHTATESAFSIVPSATGTLSWDGPTMTFTPNAALEGGATYTVTVDTSATDLDGFHPVAVHTFSFTTGRHSVGWIGDGCQARAEGPGNGPAALCLVALAALLCTRSARRLRNMQ